MSTDQEMLRKAADYILTLRDPQSGGFSFAKSNQPTLMATAYAIHALEFTKGLTRLSAAHRDAVVQFLTRCCRPDGTFCDPLFDASQIATTQHDESYFIHEATCFAQNALDALGATPPLKRAFPQTLLTPSGLKKEFDSYDWSDPHLNSNRVMFWMGQFAHEVDRHGRTELLPLLDAGLDWMDAHQSPETGLWSGPVSVSLSAAMAATFHFTFFYAFRRRPLLHLEQIIDSCLELQKPDGLFSRNDCVGQTCLDYDALDLLAKATLVTDYRRRDLQAAFHAARGALLGLVNCGWWICQCQTPPHGWPMPATTRSLSYRAENLLLRQPGEQCLFHLVSPAGPGPVRSISMGGQEEQCIWFPALALARLPRCGGHSKVVCKGTTRRAPYRPRTTTMCFIPIETTTGGRKRA